MRGLITHIIRHGRYAIQPQREDGIKMDGARVILFYQKHNGYYCAFYVGKLGEIIGETGGHVDPEMEFFPMGVSLPEVYARLDAFKREHGLATEEGG